MGSRELCLQGPKNYETTKLCQFAIIYIYSENLWKMEHFLFLQQILNRYCCRDNRVWSWLFFGIGLEFEFPPKLKIRVLAGIQILNKFQKIANFKRDYLDKDNDSEFTVKTKSAPFFMNFSNIYKLWQISLF